MTAMGTGHSELRLADLLAVLSLVADLGFGLPPEQAMRSSVIGCGIARRLDLPDADVQDVLYTALLVHLGCIGFAHETAAAYGDEFALNRAAVQTNFADRRQVLTRYLPALTAGMPPARRIGIGALEFARGRQFGGRFATATCEVGRDAARRLGLPDGVQRGLHEVFEWWDGSGAPRGLAGDQISVVARVAHAASVAAHVAPGGSDVVVRALRAQAGTILDPAVVEAFARAAADILAHQEMGDPREAILEAEPAPVQTVPEWRLVEVAQAFADVVDLKSPYLLGHSPETARLAVAAAERLGTVTTSLHQLRLAALLHDLGRVGISNATWEKPAPLTMAQWEQVRLHPYHTERILASSPVLAPLSRLAGMHHERLDGSGYHRGCGKPEIPKTARVLAAADAFQAMTQPRAHRAQLRPDLAADLLAEEAREGRLDADAVAAVLDAAGQVRRRTASDRPHGLTDREIEVLRLVARGHTNRQIARRLGISPRTAENHVQHAYTKIGVSSRAAAALFVVEHDLLA
jgi:HD-GYP domain-containing protein (c-di-GMP phosphodiesterase class II)